MQAYKQQSILNWARARGILSNNGVPGKGTVAGQHKKTLEEVQELTDAIEFDDFEEVKDAIGDIYVTLVIQAELHGLSMAECIDQAYKTISGRTGEMVNGQFVKNGG